MLTGLFLCLACGPLAGEDAITIDTRDFLIPVNVDPGRKDDIRQVVLYASPDQGRTWYKARESTAEAQAFRFSAPADGVYWFTVQVVDKQGKRFPADVGRADPGLRVRVQTRKQSGGCCCGRAVGGGTAALAPPPSNAEDEVLRLLKKIDSLEERLADLEARDEEMEALRGRVKELEKRVQQMEERRRKRVPARVDEPSVPAPAPVSPVRD